MKNCQAIILAAGQGKRMKSAQPKVVHPLLGKAMILYVVDAVKKSGIPDIVVVVGHGNEAVEKILSASGVSIAYQPVRRGTGDAVNAGLKGIRKDRKETVVLCGDAPLIRGESIRKLVRLHRRKGSMVTLLTGIVEQPGGYGRIIRDPGGKIARIVEEKDASKEELRVNEVNSGSYVFSSEYLRSHIGSLRKDNVQEEYYLTDLVYSAFFKGLPVGGHVASDPDEIMGINSREELAVASGVVALRKAEVLMRKGVTIEDPYNVYISPDVSIGADSRVEPGVVIRGDTRIGRDVEIGTGSYIEESRVQSGTKIFPYCVISHARVGKNTQIGPFARLRPEAHIMENVHIGNFVEVKKSTLGEGSKANHLAYIGDTTIGKKVNVGAGTITCNYDGITKHRTVIGDGVFIGSDTQLVAPVKVGKGALVGAGTTVTDDVPPFALVLTRPPQKNIENWVIRKMPALVKKSGLADKKGKKKGG